MTKLFFFLLSLIAFVRFALGFRLDDVLDTTEAEVPNLDSFDLSKEQIQVRMNRLFDIIDKNHDGQLDPEELSTFNIRTVQIVHDLQLSHEMELIDRNKDGLIDFDELEMSFNSEVGQDVDKYKSGLRKRFLAADKDKDGKLNKHEMGLLLNPGRDDDMLKVEVEDIIMTHDKNGDRLISMDEYASARTEEGHDSGILDTEFKPFDLNHDGFLSEDEIRAVYKEEMTEELESDLEDVKAITGNKPIDREMFEAHLDELAASSLTDHGEMLRFPSDYNLDIGENIRGRKEVTEEPITEL